MKSSIGKGTIVLIISGILCKFLGALFRLPLTNILGIEGIGVFQMVMSVYSFALILTSGGVASVLSKYVSQARARGDMSKIKSLLHMSLTYCVIFGFGGGFILFLLSNQIALIQGAEAGNLSYRLMILLVPFGGVIASMRGVFQGYENMLPTALSQVVEQLFKFVLGLLLAFILGKRGVSAGVFGAFLGITASEVIAIIFLAIYMRFKTSFASVKEKNMPLPFLKAVIPLSLGASVLPLVNAIDSFIVVSRLNLAGMENGYATSLFGLQTGVVSAILNFPLILSTALSTAILPSVSYMDASLSNEAHRSIANSLKILWLTLLPLVFGICAICRPLYALVYPSLNENMLAFATRLTYFGAVSTIITALMQFFVTLLQSKGKFYYCMISYIVGGVIKIASVILLCALPSVNIYGVVIGNIAFASVVTIMALAKNKRKISVGFYELSLPLVSSTAMLLSVMLFLRLQMPPILQIALAILLGVAVYGFCTLPITTDILHSYFHKKIDGAEKANGA